MNDPASMMEVSGTSFSKRWLLRAASVSRRSRYSAATVESQTWYADRISCVGLSHATFFGGISSGSNGGAGVDGRRLSTDQKSVPTYTNFFAANTAAMKLTITTAHLRTSLSSEIPAGA